MKSSHTKSRLLPPTTLLPCNATSYWRDYDSSLLIRQPFQDYSLNSAHISSSELLILSSFHYPEICRHLIVFIILLLTMYFKLKPFPRQGLTNSKGLTSLEKCLKRAERDRNSFKIEKVVLWTHSHAIGALYFRQRVLTVNKDLKY